jgi:hypothetical protein
MNQQQQRVDPVSLDRELLLLYLKLLLLLSQLLSLRRAASTGGKTGSTQAFIASSIPPVNQSNPLGAVGGATAANPAAPATL